MRRRLAREVDGRKVNNAEKLSNSTIMKREPHKKKTQTFKPTTVDYITLDNIRKRRVKYSEIEQ